MTLMDPSVDEGIPSAVEGASRHRVDSVDVFVPTASVTVYVRVKSVGRSKRKIQLRKKVMGNVVASAK